MVMLAGIDIGGTKCAVSLGQEKAGAIEITGKRKFATPDSPGRALERLAEELEGLLAGNGAERPAAIGISCGGPLDSKRGVILSPPNLPGWDEVEAVGYFAQRFRVPVSLQNDANACALAEWKWGAGRGLDNVVFLTFGTGMGAGLILNGSLYAGTNDMAGEVGHVRLEDDGPVGYGKPGSFEGFCSGGGIARLAASMAAKAIEAGEPPAFCRTSAELDSITAEAVARSAGEGDPLALEVFRTVGSKLGKGLAMLIDILNPQRIVIGSIYSRQRELLDGPLREVLEAETLSHALRVCDIAPSGLGEQIGDYASLSIAAYTNDQMKRSGENVQS